ncbi:zinc-ribbon domain-containing protein, partial [Escherichia coli]|uniref:zinc-ribbon domain-containing protein n=1 Tax=Escherichia coli TaxID=562 RepID=UPI002076F00B
LKTQPATGETYPKSDLFNKALQGMTVPDYTVKVRKWFCVMCDEDYEGEKCCPSCGTGVYSREGGLQEGNWKDRN